ENGSFIVGQNADIRDVNTAASSQNSVAQYETNYGNHWFPMEEMSFDRNILIKFDFSGASNTTRIVVNGGNEGKFYHDFGSLNNKGSWKTYKYDGKAGSNATNNFSSLNKIGIVLCWSGYVEAFLDNYVFIPFYKITYTGIGDEYFLYDNNGNIATEYTVDTSKTLTPEAGFVFDGWSTTENSTEALDTIELNNEDVVLYPVWRLENAVEYDINVEGMSAIEITADENTYAYTSVISADIPEKGVAWSTDNSGIAVIDENGVLTPVSPGTVTVTAKSRYYPYKSASMQVEVKYPDDAEFVNVSFEGDVLALPSDVTLLKGAKIKIGEYMNMVSAVDGKRFNGWYLDGKPVSEPTAINKDSVLTAVVNDDYNFAVAANASDWKYNVGPTSLVNNTLYCSYNSTHIDPYITNESLNIDIAKYQAIEYYIDVNYKDGGANKTLTKGTSLEGTYFARKGEGVHWQRQTKGNVISITEDGKYALVRCDMYNNAYWEGTLGLIRFDFIGNSKYEFAVRYIRFVPKDEFEDKTVNISGLDEPKPGMTPDTEATL
ncbi:MAG: InlB B-repeat-containing protein, partial [Clostridia bacterium]|nr:InlB B-repeat-containing protein [Clostridia bacterium]